jgi:hypothetical protein
MTFWKKLDFGSKGNPAKNRVLALKKFSKNGRLVNKTFFLEVFGDEKLEK